MNGSIDSVEFEKLRNRVERLENEAILISDRNRTALVGKWDFQWISSTVDHANVEPPPGSPSIILFERDGTVVAGKYPDGRDQKGVWNLSGNLLTMTIFDNVDSDTNFSRHIYHSYTLIIGSTNHPDTHVAYLIGVNHDFVLQRARKIEPGPE